MPSRFRARRSRARSVRALTSDHGRVATWTGVSRLPLRTPGTAMHDEPLEAEGLVRQDVDRARRCEIGATERARGCGYTPLPGVWIDSTLRCMTALFCRVPRPRCGAATPAGVDLFSGQWRDGGTADACRQLERAFGFWGARGEIRRESGASSTPEVGRPAMVGRGVNFPICPSCRRRVHCGAGAGRPERRHLSLGRRVAARPGVHIRRCCRRSRGARGAGRGDSDSPARARDRPGRRDGRGRRRAAGRVAVRHVRRDDRGGPAARRARRAGRREAARRPARSGGRRAADGRAACAVPGAGLGASAVRVLPCSERSARSMPCGCRWRSSPPLRQGWWR